MEESVTILWSSSANAIAPAINPIVNSLIEFLSELDHLTIIVHQDNENAFISIDIYDKHPEFTDFPYNKLARVLYESGDMVQILCNTIDIRLPVSNPDIFETIEQLINNNLQNKRWKRQ